MPLSELKLANCVVRSRDGENPPFDYMADKQNPDLDGYAIVPLEHYEEMLPLVVAHRERLKESAG